MDGPDFGLLREIIR